MQIIKIKVKGFLDSLTFGSYKKLRTSFTNNYKYRINLVSTIPNSDKDHT